MKNKKATLRILITTSVLAIGSCHNSDLQDNVNDGAGSNSEIRANCESIRIGKQVWMAANLNVTIFRNGDSIQEAKTDEQWYKAGINGQPARCYYDNDPKNGEKYGSLYNWYAVNDRRGLAPSGWHAPSDVEWSELSNFLGGDNKAGKLKSRKGWAESGNGTNESGFSALPGGTRLYNGKFAVGGDYGIWWSSSERDTNIASYRSMFFFIDFFGGFCNLKRSGYSVRCIKN